MSLANGLELCCPAEAGRLTRIVGLTDVDIEVPLEDIPDHETELVLPGSGRVLECQVSLGSSSVPRDRLIQGQDPLVQKAGLCSNPYC